MSNACQTHVKPVQVGGGNASNGFSPTDKLASVPLQSRRVHCFLSRLGLYHHLFCIKGLNNAVAYNNVPCSVFFDCITSGKLELRKCQVKLSEVLRSAVEASMPFIDEAGHELTVAFPEVSVYLLADPHRLAQVVSNLLNNAAKYTPEGGHIWLNVEQQGSDVEISVRDNGIGIPFEMHSRIFEMFAQIDRPKEKGYTGLGIGLTLVKSLVDMHGGVIEVRSEGTNQGSEFSVRLPVLVETPVDQQPLNQSPERATVKPRRKVLVVDDNKDAAVVLSVVVKMLGNEVKLASDGEEAIQVAAEFLPDLVLMDIGMPKMNGYEAARHIRQQPWGQKMMFVALTGWGQDEDKQRTKDAGFDFHLVKPVEPSELQRLLAEIKPKEV
jgi:CheY-like chemotaxis protein